MIHDLENQSAIDDFGLYLLKNIVTRHCGERCDEYDGGPQGCCVCNAWAFVDGLEELVKETRSYVGGKDD